MTHLRLTALALIVACAGTLAAQKAPPGPGDLIPRDNTIAYMVSDHPDAVYRLFGHDKQGGWKLRSWALGMLNKQHEKDPDSEEAQRDRQIYDWVFGSYEAIDRVEIGLVDVTLDGPKYLVHLKTHAGSSIDPTPDFLKDFLAETKEYQGVKYYLYRVEDKDKDGGEDEPMPGKDGSDMPAPKQNHYGMDRYYVAATPSGLLVANFESTIREAIEKLSSGDYSNSLSSRDEFASWLKERKPHDLSIFVIGHQIQAAIERLLPSKEQAGMDAEGVYNGVDKWLQFREYKYVVFDLDYEDAARGITLAASFKTRRQTRLLDKLAIEPAEFKMLKYVPEGPILTAGVQLGDAKTTFSNLKDLAHDVEKWAAEVKKGMRGHAVEPQPVEPPKEPGEPSEDGEGGIRKNVEPGKFAGKLSGQQGAGEGEGKGESAEEQGSKVDKALDELEKMLKEYGTSTDEVLSVLGTEAVAFALPNVDGARAKTGGTAGFGDVFESANIGIAISVKDIAKAKAILAKAREADPEGAFRGFTEVGYQGHMLQVTSEQPFGYTFTDDALLVVIAMGATEKDATQPVIAGLKGMIDASTHTTTGGSSFVKNGSKFLEIDFGTITRIVNQLNEERSKRLDRYARPPIDTDPVTFITDMTLGLRLKEHKDGVELAVRIAGLPDFGKLLDSDASPFGHNGKRDAFGYSQDNLRTLWSAMNNRADAGKPVDLDSMLKDKDIRVGVLQVPFDKRWKGDMAKIGYTSLDQIVRDESGKLPEWVDADAAKMIEANETAGFRSIKLADGDVAGWIKDYKTGFIIAYEEKADTLGGHVVLYADGQVGWLAADALTKALDLNAKDKPVPAEENWIKLPGKDGPDEPKEPEKPGPKLPNDDPWVPGSK